MIAYSVFLNDKLIFSHTMIFAIWARKNLAERFMHEMRGYYPNEPYSVREIELDVEVAHGNAKIAEEII